MLYQLSFQVATRGRGSYSISGDIGARLEESGILTSNSLSVPVAHGRCDLGTWQGVYVWEHRHAAQRRRVTLTVYGE